jgi:hypothetical protein
VKRLISATALLLVTCMALLVPIATAMASSQNWLLSSSGHSVAGLTMFRGVGSTPSGSLSIPSKGSAMWVADEAAYSDVTFSDGAWVLFLDTSNWASACRAEIGHIDNGGSFTQFSTFTGTSTYVSGILKVQVQLASMTVPEGEYIAVRVYNDTGMPRTITTTGRSYLTSPDSDPGYPLPELAAGILMGVGLVGIGGFVLIKRRRDSTKTAIRVS